MIGFGEIVSVISLVMDDEYENEPLYFFTMGKLQEKSQTNEAALKFVPKLQVKWNENYQASRVAQNLRAASGRILL